MRAIQLFLLLVSGLAVRAEATAIASVKEAFWQADFAYYDDGVSQLRALPQGVTLSCTGTAMLHGAAGCIDRENAYVESSNDILQTQIVDALGGVVLQNTGGVAYNGAFVFRTSFSSFNPGGPEIGASVDNGAREYASFFSVVQGPGLFDLHGCDMQSGGAMGFIAEKKSCGVKAPDASEGEFGFWALAPGAMARADFQIYIRVDARGEDPVVPEVPSPVLFVSALALFGLSRRYGVKA